MLEGSLTMQLEFESLDTMDCYGTATFDTSASGLSGTGSCYDDAGDAWDFTFTDAGATVVYEYQPCLEASTDTVYGTVEPGGSLSFNMNLDLASCDSSGEIYVTADVQF